MSSIVKTDFRHLDLSSAALECVQQEAEKLNHFCDRITTCHVVVDGSHPRHGHARVFGIRIEVGVPGRRLVVNHTEPFVTQGEEETAHRKLADASAAPRDVYAAIRTAFHVMRQQVKSYSEGLHHAAVLK